MRNGYVQRLLAAAALHASEEGFRVRANCFRVMRDALPYVSRYVRGQRERYGRFEGGDGRRTGVRSADRRSCSGLSRGARPVASWRQ